MNHRLVALALVQGFGYVATFGWNIIAARVTSVRDYGVISLAVSLILALQVLFEFGQQRTLVRFLSPLFAAGDFQAARQLSRRAVVLPILITMLVGAGLAAWTSATPDSTRGGIPIWQWMLVLPAGLGAALMNIQTGAYIAAGRPIASSALSLVAVPVFLCVVFLWKGWHGQVGVESLYSVMALAYVGGGVFSILRLLRGEPGDSDRSPVAFKTVPGIPSRSDYYSFARKALIVGLLTLGLAYSDRYLLGAFASLSAVGMYSLPARTARLLNFPVYFLNPIAGPAYTQADHQDTMAAALGVYRASARLIASIVLPVGLTGAVYSAQLLVLLGGEQYAPAASTMTILVAGAIVLSLSGNSGLLLQMGGRENDEVRATACGLFVNVVVAAALLGWLGIVGIAIGTSLGYAVVAGGRLMACWSRWRIAIWDLLGLRQFFAAVLHLVVVFLGGLLGLPWMVVAGIAMVACILACSPWSAIRELARSFTPGARTDRLQVRG